MIEALKDRTYMVRHSPNCPKRFEVRLTGLGLLSIFAQRASRGIWPNLKSGDVIGYGHTADEAAADALEQERRSDREKAQT